jgi:hypothetical protein
MQKFILKINKKFFYNMLRDFENWCNKNNLIIKREEITNNNAIYIIKTKLFSFISFRIKLKINFNDTRNEVEFFYEMITINGTPDERIFPKLKEKEVSNYLNDYFKIYCEQVKNLEKTEKIEITSLNKSNYFKNSTKWTWITAVGVYILYKLIDNLF